ncbi:MAG: glycosyltransferase [Ruminococcus flavefaciens]
MGVGVVLVTFNRLDKLKVALDKYDKQTFVPEYILVVDNHSNDGTKEYLEQWVGEEAAYKKYVHTLSSNTGGAGGFYKGMEEAVKLDAEWIWLSDDDAYPRPDCIANLMKFYDKQSADEKKGIVALCSTVYNMGEIHKQHRNHLSLTTFKCKIYSTELHEYKKEAFKVEIFSYVGAMIKKSAIEKVGFDRKEFFIYCDDQEHSIRLSKAGTIYCVTNSIIDHDTPPFNKDEINWGRYYKKRNDLLMRKYNFPFRYYILRYIKGYIKEASFLSKNPDVLKKELKAAYKDAWNNVTGLHKVYRPGWKPENEK